MLLQVYAVNKVGIGAASEALQVGICMYPCTHEHSSSISALLLDCEHCTDSCSETVDLLVYGI